MSRFLTPSKVGLLALISLYVDSVVPKASAVSILSFIVSELVPSVSSTIHGQDRKSSLANTKSLTIDEFQKATAKHPSGIPGRTVWDLFLKKIWELNSFDALNEFFDSLGQILPKSRETLLKEAENGAPVPSEMRLSRTSPLGAFVRRARLEFTRLQLHDSIKLWKSFVLYRQSTMLMWRRRNPAASRNSFDVNLAMSTSRIHDLLYDGLEDTDTMFQNSSMEDVEKFLEFQVNQMQKIGLRISESMKESLESVIQSGITVPSLSHYVKFLDSWKMGDYSSSFEHLHRYFDYTMQTRDRTFYQYALLNLSLLHADFGCYPEALAAMHESISAARENKDLSCLNYSLSWMYHFTKAHPREVHDAQTSGILGNDKEALLFLKAKAKETQMWSLLSTSLLSEAALALQNGESLAHVFENIARSSFLNVSKDTLSVIGGQMKLEATNFSRLGLSFLSISRVELYLECYIAQSPAEDSLYFICYEALSRASRGQLGQAFALMGDIEPAMMRTLKHQRHWTTYVGVLRLQNALLNDDLDTADIYLTHLQANVVHVNDLIYLVGTLAIDLLIRRHEYTGAMAALEQLSIDTSLEECDICTKVKLMVLKAQIYDKAGLPQKGFSIALKAATLAYKTRLLPILWQAVGAVCRVLTSLREFRAAESLLKSIVPRVLECDDCSLVASTFSSLADTHMGLAGESVTDSLKQEHMTKTLEYLGRAFDEYSSIGDIRGQSDVLAKRATIMHLTGDLVLANDYAAKYLSLSNANADLGR